VPFLTELDPRLAVRGSRDPLAAQAVWSTLGRRLVGNLTLSSAEAAGFRTLMLGYLLAERYRRDSLGSLHLFLRWEQACAYARVATRYEDGPLGGRRARARTSGSHEVVLGHERRHQVLGDQRAGGLWTLYHRAALLSGLVTDERRLTPAGSVLAQAWLDEVPAQVVRRVRLDEPASLRVKKNSITPSDDARDLSELLHDGVPADRTALREALVRGRPPGAHAAADRTRGAQAELAASLDRLPAAVLEGNRRALVLALVTDAEATGAQRLGHTLLDVLACESVLAPAQALLDHVLVDGHGRSAAQLGDQVRESWPQVSGSVQAERFRDLARLLAPVLGRERSEQWVRCAEQMSEGAWTEVVESVLRVNGSAMQSRRGAPWASLTPAGRIDVRVRVGATLPDEERVLLGWRNPYYLPPVLSLRADLEPAA
jgi:hypothetical protein